MNSDILAKRTAGSPNLADHAVSGDRDLIGISLNIGDQHFGIHATPETASGIFRSLAEHIKMRFIDDTPEGS